MVKKISDFIWNQIDFSSAKKDTLQEIISSYIKKIIVSGKLAQGSELPSQRELAQHIGVSLQTISRAIDHLITEGYLYSIPRKGVFVCEKYKENAIYYPLLAAGAPEIFNLSTNSPAIVLEDMTAHFKLTSSELSQEALPDGKRRLIEAFFMPFLNTNPTELKKQKKQILTYGCYQGLFLCLLFLKLTHRNLGLLCEKITFTPILKICHTLKIPVFTVENTDTSCETTLEDIAKIQSELKEKQFVFFTINPLHNPLLSTQKEKNLSLISEYCIKNNLYILEDGSYFFSPSQYTSFYELAPYHTFSLLSTSKFLPSALRLGFLCLPFGIDASAFSEISSSISWSEPLLEAHILAGLIGSHKIFNYLENYREEIRKRNEEATRILGQHIYRSIPEGCHLLLNNPERKNLHLLSNGTILVSEGKSFCVSNEQPPPFDRVSLISTQDRTKLRQALHTVKQILEG